MKYIAAISALAAVASAKNCQNLTVSIYAEGRNGVFDISSPSNNIEVTNFILDLARQGTNYTASVLTGYQTVSGTYNIGATYCEPDSGPSDVLQVLTHGIGFDRSYWDAPVNNYNYSYVNEAVDQYGYSTFSWDRLGIAESQNNLNPLTEVQSDLEVGALYSLTLGLRAGNISGISTAYNKVVHVGHSYGSEHTYALTAMHPDVSNGIALTGFSQNGSFLADFLLGGNFIEANHVSAFSSLPDGYFAAGDKVGVHINFFSPGDFDPDVLTYAYKKGQPVTDGELLTIGGEAGSVNDFAGPVHIITGAEDVPYCGGNCLAAPTGYSSIPETSKMYFPDASNFTVTIIPGAGHGLNLEYTWPQTYASILDYFEQQGLGANGTSSSGNGGGWRR